MRIRCLVTSAVLTLSASGCWFQAGFGPARTAHNDLESAVTAANVDQLEVAWTASVGGPAQEAVIAGGRAFVRSPGGLSALRLGSGEQLWRVTEARPIPNVALPLVGDAVPAVAEGKVYVPFDTAPARQGPCGVAIVDAATGAESNSRFTSPTDPVNPAPIEAGWLCETDDALATGSSVVVPWTYLFQYAEPHACDPDPQFIGVAGTGLTGVDPDTPSENWTADFTTSGCGVTEPPIPPFGPATLVGSATVAPSGTRLRAVGDWEVDVGDGIVGPATALANGDIAVALAGGQVALVDGTTHAVEWTGGIGDSQLVTPLAATPTTIFATYPDSTVAAFPVDGCGSTVCGPTWTAQLSGPASTRASLGGDVVYVGSADGSLTALPADGCGGVTCAPLWTGDTGDSVVTGAPSIWNGTIVVGSEDGTVTAFRLP